MFNGFGRYFLFIIFIIENLLNNSRFARHILALIVCRMILILSSWSRILVLIHACIDAKCRNFLHIPKCYWTGLSLPEARLYDHVVEGDYFFDDLTTRGEANFNCCLYTSGVICNLEDLSIVPFSAAVCVADFIVIIRFIVEKLGLFYIRSISDLELIRLSKRGALHPELFCHWLWKYFKFL